MPDPVPSRPLWVSVTGSLGVAFAVLSLLGTLALSTGSAPALDRTSASTPEKTESSISSPWHDALVPKAWVKPLAPVSRVTGALVALFYLLASLRLMSMTRSGLRLFLWALAVSSLFHLARASVALGSLSILGVALVGGSLFWLVVNGILFGVVRLNDRSVFR